MDFNFLSKTHQMIYFILSNLTVVILEPVSVQRRCVPHLKGLIYVYLETPNWRAWHHFYYGSCPLKKAILHLKRANGRLILQGTVFWFWLSRLGGLPVSVRFPVSGVTKFFFSLKSPWDHPMTSGVDPRGWPLTPTPRPPGYAAPPEELAKARRAFSSLQYISCTVKNSKTVDTLVRDLMQSKFQFNKSNLLKLSKRLS